MCLESISLWIYVDEKYAHNKAYFDRFSALNFCLLSFCLSHSCWKSAFIIHLFRWFFVIYWQLRTQYKQVMLAITHTLTLFHSPCLSVYFHKTVNKSNNQRVKTERTSNINPMYTDTYTLTRANTRFPLIRIICCVARLKFASIHLVNDWTHHFNR